MKKVHLALRWLNMAQALELLEELTLDKVTEEVLIQFCCEKKASVYVDIWPPGLEGTVSSTKEKVTMLGIQEVLNPDIAFRDEDPSCAVFRYETAHWIGLLPRAFRAAKFKSAEIQALAVWINEQEKLYQQAELDRSAKETASFLITRAEAEATELSQQLGQERATSEITGRPPLPSPRNKTTLQEQVVLDTLRKLGYEPKALPPRQQGSKWVKTATRKALAGNSLFEGKTIFDKAWDRLRAANQIVELQ